MSCSNNFTFWKGLVSASIFKSKDTMFGASSLRTRAGSRNVHWYSFVLQNVHRSSGCLSASPAIQNNSR